MPPWTLSNPKLHYSILEEQPVGTVLTQLQATDADSNIAEYKLEPNDYFEINNITGLLNAHLLCAFAIQLHYFNQSGQIRTIDRIDYEQIREIVLKATVTDTGIPQLSATAQLIVEVTNMNDNEPHFQYPEYRMSVAENAIKGSVVGKVEASDADEGKTEYA